MKYHAEFYHMSTGYVDGSIPPVFKDSHKKLIPACGDRSVIILDGRSSRYTHEMIAREECLKRGYLAYRIMKGGRFTTAKPVSPITPV
jgi:hypothetical protein